MKIYKKEDCTYVDGYVVCGDEVIGVPTPVIRQLNRLETDMQKAEHRRANKVELKTPEPFVRKHEGKSRIVVTPETPALDEAVDKAMALRDDLDTVEAASAVNDYLADIELAIEWVQSPNIVSSSTVLVEKFDLPSLGNPLELGEEDIVEAVVNLF